MPEAPASLGLEFHVSRQARQKYALQSALFGLRGNVLFANFQAVRNFAHRLNSRRQAGAQSPVRAADINAMGLIDEILHFVSAEYRRQRQPFALHGALAYLQERFGETAVERLLRRFAEIFPAAPVYRGEMSLEAYFAATVDGLPAREAVLEEILMLALAHRNPALRDFSDLFDDAPLRQDTIYPAVFDALHAFFATQPPFENHNLIDLLAEPARRAPHSLQEQLRFLLIRWRALLGEAFSRRLLGGLDFLAEETRIRIGTGGAPPPAAPRYEAPRFPSPSEEAPERFSPDREWMPSLVMIAKHTYVWLDQLSRQYRRPITRLDQIPEQELAALSRRGFSGLWLIGLWERSSASRKIKHLCGNPDAIASAYSLYEYTIAADLGGEAAYRTLKERAARHGIRLAADMVPNHTGIYSRWVVEHPDWFLSLPHAPYPNYAFNGPDLSDDPRVGIYLEDHYYTRTDAAVVFKRVERSSGDTRYIYHGNDGTAMPWNDTAQLNYLNPEVREAVIQTILRVARMFPVIRFDAAMTLTKKHYQRLWFPEPGSGGAIPSRAEFGMTKEQFDAAMPQEFWREVVDRIAAEAPDTLLLAEAFWMMEGYFVRSLGMHRVYNSAFMNMLRDEKNAEYRAVIKNTLEFDPEILKRYVNFMNNPDERTAVEQFGKGDKYFGICLLMATLPGLPMFGHGQIEGFAEKYGMEYRRAYWSEQPDSALVARHEAEITPLLHRRRLFAGVEHFLLYDFFTPEGAVDENVFAYSNRLGEQRALVVYHNRYAAARGWLRASAARAVKDSTGTKRLEQRTLAEGLALRDDPAWFTIFRDHKSGLEYIRNNRALHRQGLYLELGAYQYHIFLDFRQVRDADGRYARLHAELGGRGVPGIEDALRALELRPVHQPLRFLLEQVPALLQGRPDSLEAAAERARALAQAVCEFAGLPGEPRAFAGRARRGADIALRLPALPFADEGALKPVERALDGFLGEREARRGVLLLWALLHPLSRLADPPAGGAASAGESAAAQWFDEWLFAPLVQETLTNLGYAQPEHWIRVLRALLRWQDWPIQARRGLKAALRAWLEDPEVRSLLKVNEYEGVLWYNKEAFEAALGWMLAAAAVRLLSEPQRDPEAQRAALMEAYALTRALRQAETRSRYQVARLLEAVGEG